MGVKKMNQIKNTSLKKEDTQKVNNIVGQKVVDDKGNEIGKIKSVHIDPENLTVEGITIANGVFQEKSYVGKGYICNLSNQGAVLCDTPLTEVIGKKVMDSSGKDIGEVKSIYRARKTNSLYSITIDRGMSTNDLIVTDKVIDNIGEKVVLNEKIEY